MISTQEESAVLRGQTSHRTAARRFEVCREPYNMDGSVLLQTSIIEAGHQSILTGMSDEISLLGQALGVKRMRSHGIGLLSESNYLCNFKHGLHQLNPVEIPIAQFKCRL